MENFPRGKKTIIRLFGVPLPLTMCNNLKNSWAAYFCSVHLSISIFQTSSLLKTQTSKAEDKRSHSCSSSITWKKEASYRILDLFSFSSREKKKRKEVRAGHQKIHKYHQVHFSHFFQNGYKYNETCKMDLAKLSLVRYFSYKFNGEYRTQRGYTWLILKSTLNIMKHSSLLADQKISQLQCTSFHRGGNQKHRKAQCSTHSLLHFSSTENVLW